MFGHWGYGYGYGFGWIFMILWWAFILAAIVATVKWIVTPTSGGHRPPREKSALDILKERYARGEIEQEEFLRKKHELSE